MSKDIFYKTCCIKNHECSGRIEWHHNLIYAGQRVNEIFAILPVCQYHHFLEKRKDIAEHLDYIMLCKATDEQLIAISKAINYLELKKRLSLKYGTITTTHTF